MLKIATKALLLTSCFSLRAIDTTRATTDPNVCGNGVRELEEVCDGADQGGGSLSCIRRGAGAAGEVGCGETCELDTTACFGEQSARLRFWLSGNSKDNGIIDYSSKRTAVTSTAAITLSPTVAIASDPPNDRAYEIALGGGHAVATMNGIPSNTPMTYELWLAPTAATPTDHDTIVFEHEAACTLSLLANHQLKATCGMASVTHPTVLNSGTYVFVAVQVAKATLRLWVDTSKVEADRAPVLSGASKFAAFNSINDTDGPSKQFVGLVDELRLLDADRGARELCLDAGRDDCGS